MYCSRSTASAPSASQNMGLHNEYSTETEHAEHHHLQSSKHQTKQQQHPAGNTVDWGQTLRDASCLSREDGPAHVCPRITAPVRGLIAVQQLICLHPCPIHQRRIHTPQHPLHHQCTHHCPNLLDLQVAFVLPAQSVKSPPGSAVNRPVQPIKHHFVLCLQYMPAIVTYHINVHMVQQAI